MIIRALRAVRKSLEDDGFVGRVLESTAYRTVTSMRMILLVLTQSLWAVETFFGEYFVTPADRFTKELFGGPNTYGPLGQALQSPALQLLDKVLLAWLVFDIAVALLYSFLESFTLEEDEKAQREYDQLHEKLGDTPTDAHSNFLTSITDSRWFRYVQRGVIACYVIGILINFGGAIGGAISEEMLLMQDGADDVAPSTDLAKINPWRDLLPEHDAVLKELIYIRHVLSELTPTTLPDDDYQLFSNMIRSLETRTDIPWRVYEETEVDKTILTAANRGTSARDPIADEPFSIEERVKALHSHWHSLALGPSKPERWEDASDTTFLQPLIVTNSYGSTEKVGEGTSGFRLILTLEQQDEATRVYNKWRRDRDRKVSYLKEHPPTPMAWVPVAKSHTGIRNAWDDVFEDGRVEAGRHASSKKLAGSKQWKPIFRSLLTERIPIGWLPPGQEPKSDEEAEAELKVLFQEMDAVKARREKQEEYLAQLKAALEVQAKKEEL